MQYGQLISKRFNEFKSIYGAVLNSCHEKTAKTALTGNSGDIYSYENIRKLTQLAAGGLKNLGLQKGDRVGLLSENCPLWGIAYLSVLAAGGVVVPFDAALKVNELIPLFRVSKIKLLFCSEKLSPASDEIISLNDLPIKIINLTGNKDTNFNSLTTGESYINENIRPEDKAAIIYTSGTTGAPKGVILTNQNILSNLDSVSRALPFYSDDVFLSLLPLHHTFEATCGFLVPLTMGLSITYATSLTSKGFINDIKKHNISVLVAVPLLYEKLYKTIRRRLKDLPALKRVMLNSFFAASGLGQKMNLNLGHRLFKSLRQKGGLDSIRMFISGGAPLPVHIGRWYNLIGFTLLEGYGMTECAPVLAVNQPDKFRIGSVGPILPGIEVEIESPTEDGIGEIKVRGGNNTPGYLDNPEETEQLLKNGWLYTGDMGYLKDNFLYITGRRKNLIISGGGKNIFPEEIEESLNEYDIVLESLVTGHERDGKTGEEVWATIVPDREQIELDLKEQNREISPEIIRELIAEIVKSTNDKLADYKRIVHFEIRTEEFEKTTSRKIKRT